MIIKLAALCDYVSLTNDNKLNLMGIFGEFHPQKLPITLAGFFVLVLTLPRTAEGQQLTVEAIGRDGQPLFQVTRLIKVHALSPQINGIPLLNKPIEFREVISLVGLRAGIADEYMINIKIGEESRVDIFRFEICQPPVLVT